MTGSTDNRSPALRHHQYTFPFSDDVSSEPLPFQLSAANADAVKFLQSWQEDAESRGGQGLAISGPAGAGKSFFLQYAAARQGARLFDGGDISSAVMVSENGENVAIDNADAITDPLLLKAIIDQCRETRCNYLLAGDGAPESWGQRASTPVADLVSRLASLPRCVLDSPDQGLMAEVLTARLARRQVRISPELAEFAAARLRRSFRSLAVFQDMLDQEALQQLKAIDKALVLAVLESLPEHTLS